MENLRLYGNFGRNFVFCKDRPINSGEYGTAYRYGEDKVVKVLNTPDTYMQRRVMSAIKKLNLRNFYKIHELLSTNQFGFRNLAGYVSSYCESDDIDILTMPSEYLVENARMLAESVSRLTEHGICIEDLYSKNVILNSSNITVIDTDLYRLCSGVKSSDLDFHNNLVLKDLFYSLLWEAHHSYHEDQSVLASQLRDIFNELINRKDVSDMDAISRGLTKCKYPIDYVRKRVK